MKEKKKKKTLDISTLAKNSYMLVGAHVKLKEPDSEAGMFCFMVNTVEMGSGAICMVMQHHQRVMKFYANRWMDTFHLIKYILVGNKETIPFYTSLFHILLEYMRIPIYNGTENSLREKHVLVPRLTLTNLQKRSL